MKIKNIFYIAIFLCFVFLMFSACEPIQYSVFKAVIEAKPEQDNSLNNALSVIGIADDGNNYYLAAGYSMWTRSISLNSEEQSVVWNSVAMPAAGDLCTAFTLYNNELYAGFIHKATDGTFTCSLQKGSLSADPAWQPVSDALTDNKQVIRLFTVNGVLFINVLGATYTLYYFNGASFAATGIDTAKQVTSLIWDGAAYWAVTANGLYKGNTPDAFVSATMPPDLTASDTLNAVFRSSAGRYFISASNGIVYVSDNPDVGWTASGEQLVGTRKVYFTQFTEINSNVLVGAVNYGFYQMPAGDYTQIARYSNDQVSEITQSSILNFYTQPAFNLVFFLTGSNGLYRNSYTADGGWGSKPVHE